ncbi:uncharacterized protein LOC132307123 [Cornus florida]|uniref:uncharacterized protein LOC132307123 n=1 Tax=Cornus florida TaxID=4283 RepID=UPI00289B288D|nr:uncharacterized protein LOC132307123 [Cornus florida]
MAKRELSSTLKNLKFMQRAAQREEKTEKEEEVIPDGNFPSSNIPKKCLVIVEGDPHPGAVKGRMSFQSFNPSVDKLNEEEGNLHQPEASVNQSGTTASRENGSTQDGSESLKTGSSSSDANGDLKRKQVEVVSEVRYPNKSQKNVQGNQESSSNNNMSSHKQSKREKLDWNVLRPPKGQGTKTWFVMLIIPWMACSF